MDSTAHPTLTTAWAIVFLSTPVFFLLQIAALLILLWQVVYRRRLIGSRTLERWSLQAGVAIAPVVMLFMSTSFTGGYQEERGHWFFHIHDGLAGLTLVPVYALGSFIVGRGITRYEYRLRSGIHLIVLWTLTVVCLWYSFATASLGMTDDELLDLRDAAWVPFVAAANYALIAFEIRRHGHPDSASLAAAGAWFAALFVSLVAKAPLAKRAFDALPVEAPAGYGDCFVVSAALRGHPDFVGSDFDPSIGRTVNGQWRTLRAFEDRLAIQRPELHRHLRSLYNRIGPVVAGRIRSPLAADVVYLLLKPIEWSAGLYPGVRSNGTAARSRSPKGSWPG